MPVTVTVGLPVAVLAAVQDRVLVPEVVVALNATEGELSEHVSPVCATCDNATVPVKPCRPATVIVDVPAAPPAVTETLVGLAVTV